MDTNREIKNHIIKISVLVLAIVTLGVSLTYAYYTAKFSGSTEIPNTTAAKFNITSTLQTAPAISNLKMSLIDADKIEEEADKIEFSVTNSEESTVSGKYFIHLINISLTKNLYSQYFKWQLVRKTDLGESEISNGTFENVTRTDQASEDEASNALTTVEDITLNKVALEIPAGTTDELLFRIWLENDPEENQANEEGIDLTEGSFSGKLRIEATPKKP